MKRDKESKAKKTADANDLVAAFLARGGQISKMPAVEAQTFACAECGHTGIMGFAPGKARKCPKCRSPLK